MLTLISSAALTGQKEDHSMETIFPWVGRDRFTTSGYESKHTAKTSKTFQRDGKFLTYLSPTGHLYRRNKEFLCSWFLDFRESLTTKQTRTYIENDVFPFLVSENGVLVYKNGFNCEPWVRLFSLNESTRLQTHVDCSTSGPSSTLVSGSSSMVTMWTPVCRCPEEQPLLLTLASTQEMMTYGFAADALSQVNQSKRVLQVWLWRLSPALLSVKWLFSPRMKTSNTIPSALAGSAWKPSWRLEALIWRDWCIIIRGRLCVQASSVCSHSDSGSALTRFTAEGSQQENIRC